jgi:hypothetical protein
MFNVAWWPLSLLEAALVSHGYAAYLATLCTDSSLLQLPEFAGTLLHSLHFANSMISWALLEESRFFVV